MSNRTALTATVIALVAFAAYAGFVRFRTATPQPRPQLAKTEAPAPEVPQVGSPSFAVPRPPNRFTDPLPPPAPLPSPQTQPAEPKKLPPSATRPAKFADVNQDELTPQKIARVALSYVGADPVADQVWLAAINNPNFTPKERKDLIEDLNEEGFDDPKNLTRADLPLIVARLQMIEALAPQAADETNAAAFAEAYKDLANMFAKLTQ